MQIDGVWVGWGLGDHSLRDNTVQNIKSYMRKMYASYAGDLNYTNLFDQQLYDAVVEMQKRLAADGRLQWDHFILGVLDLPTQIAMGFKKKTLPVFVHVEGHQSNMFFGPVADTARILEEEKLCKSQPTGYDNGKVPFNNKDGVNALAENIRLRVPADADLYIGGFSQGSIIVYDYFEQYGIPPRLKGVLNYGNPCRGFGRVAEWCDSATIEAVKKSHGLDPIKRYGLPGCVDLDAAGIPNKDVLRKGDIFADETSSLSSKVAMAVYQAVVRGDFMSNPWSIAANIASMFVDPTVTIQYVYYIVLEIMGGIKFLATNPNPHYAPFDISGGLNWMRGLMRNG